MAACMFCSNIQIKTSFPAENSAVMCCALAASPCVAQASVHCNVVLLFFTGSSQLGHPDASCLTSGIYKNASVTAEENALVFRRQLRDSHIHGCIINTHHRPVPHATPLILITFTWVGTELLLSGVALVLIVRLFRVYWILLLTLHVSIFWLCLCRLTLLTFNSLKTIWS